MWPTTSQTKKRKKTPNENFETKRKIKEDKFPKQHTCTDGNLFVQARGLEKKQRNSLYFLFVNFIWACLNLCGKSFCVCFFIRYLYIYKCSGCVCVVLSSQFVVALLLSKVKVEAAWETTTTTTTAWLTTGATTTTTTTTTTLLEHKW